MNTDTLFDSKLFYGREIGSVEQIVPLLMNMVEHPPRECTNWIDQVNWINTQLPKGLWLEVTYPNYSCEPSEMRVHFSLIEDGKNGNYFTSKQLKKAIQKANYSAYGYYLGKLNIEYSEPVFYTKYSIYD